MFDLVGLEGKIYKRLKARINGWRVLRRWPLPCILFIAYCIMNRRALRVLHSVMLSVTVSARLVYRIAPIC